MIFPRSSWIFALLLFSYVAASSSDTFDNQLGLAHPKISSDQTVLYNVTDEVEANQGPGGSCQNAHKLRQKAWAKQGCDPDRSKGFLSSHNCFNKGGKAYFCYQNGESKCWHPKSDVKTANKENGECFI